MKLKLFKNESGASLPLVLAIVSVGVAGLSYTITDLLPRLQKEKTKIEASINYRVFMASLNDYIVHGIRERWCFNTFNGNDSDLLISDKCGSGKAMEEIVVYPGNLERILWTADNIGSTPTSLAAAKKDNRILAINYARKLAGLTSTVLSYDKVSPPGGKISFKISKNSLKDMTDQHPLYVMTKEVRECIESVDIDIFQVKDTSNIQSGDERKIGISITSNISPLKMRCYAVRTVKSTSYYTFFPRRLHTFSLMKYGNLDGSLHNEFHGPVYLAGDFVLPDENFDKTKGTVFHNTLTFGVFNGGSSLKKYRAGRILKSDLNNYTFTDRGHPYRSKQDNYPGFQGFLGGVRLDATEDKGFYNLFNYTNSSAADIEKLKECIEEAKYQTTPSLNESSLLAYSSYTGGSQKSSLKLSFTERNRFKSGGAPSTIKETFEAKSTKKGSKKDSNQEDEEDPKPEILFKVPPPPNGVVSYGEISISPSNELFDLQKDNHYLATIGTGSSAIAFFNYEAFDLTSDTLQTFLDNLKEADNSNFDKAIDPSHVLFLTNERVNYQKKGEALRQKCDEKASDECAFFGYKDFECSKVTTSTIKQYCNYTKEVDDYKNARKVLEDEIIKMKSYVDSDKEEDLPQMIITMGDFLENNKLVLNQKQLNFQVNDAWKYFYPFLKLRLTGLNIEFKSYHYSTKNLTIRMKLMNDAGNDFEFSSQNFGPNQDKKLYTTSWRNTFDNTIISPDPKPITELDCPQGMGLADWDLDMSQSSNFAWNYANTPGGVSVDTTDHESLPEIIFTKELLEGHKSSTSKSVVEHCIVPPDRTHIYGFYVCNRLTIRDRTTPLHMIGTFIVKDLDQPKMKTPVFWYSIWDTKAGDFILTDLNRTNPTCSTGGGLTSKTFNDLMKDNQLKAKMTACSAQDLVTNGPNNFNWTTVDPDIGIAKSGDSMTSQKANRIQRWVTKEESRVEVIR